MCSKLAVKTPEQHVVLVNLNIFHIFFYCFFYSIVDFEQVNLSFFKVLCWSAKVQSSLFQASIYLFKVNNRNDRKKMRSMFKVNNKDRRTTSMTSKMFLLLSLNTFHILLFLLSTSSKLMLARLVIIFSLKWKAFINGFPKNSVKI